VSSTLAFLSWYAIVTILGWLTFPLAYFLFPALADRGYSLSRVAGLLIWSYLFWIFTSLGLTQNTIGGILFALLALMAVSAWALSNVEYRISNIVSWLKSNLRLVITVEALFLIAFVFLAFLRAGNPELDGTERPMELMFINAILRSPTFPPHDSWLSGYAISYYYFGYVMTAMLAKLAGLTGSIAHNLMTSLIFALAAIGAYGILYNLLSAINDKTPSENRESEIGNRKSNIVLPFLAPLFLLIVSNLEGFLEVLHRRGIFWPPNSTSNFWTWLGIKELSEAPSQPLGWIPDRFWWWWRASRVISDFDLRGGFQEVIDEFPFFSFLLGDLHPHVLAIPFNLLAVAIALNLFMGGWRGEIDLFGFHLDISKTGFLFAALTLGGLAFLNTWDILVGAALIVLAYVLFRVHEEGWSWSRLEDVFILGIPLGLLALILYLPFYFGFSSQASGILPNIINPTRGMQLWVMFAPFFIPLIAYLVYVSFNEKHKARWSLSLLLVTGFIVLLWAFSWVFGWSVKFIDPLTAQQYFQYQGVAGLGSLFAEATLRRLSYIGGLLTLLALLIPALAFLTADHRPLTDDHSPSTFHSQPSTSNHSPFSITQPPSTFVFILITLAAILVMAPEFVYLHDQFGTRMNTIFKFYYQAWLLWSIAAAFGTAILLQNLRGARDWAFRIGIFILLFMSLTYPALSIANKTSNFNPPFGWTLDDFTRIQRNTPDEAAAIEWLKSAPDGVIAEAVGGGYTSYGRISTYTGLPTVLNWPDHESQWGRTGADFGTRQDDIKRLYTVPSWSTALTIINQYNIRYIYIGDLERSTYQVQEDKFRAHLIQVFHQGNVTIYEVH
jgi:YYY domain-containing protein